MTQKEIKNEEVGVMKYVWLFLTVNAIRFFKMFPNNDPIIGPLLSGSRGNGWFSASVFMVSAIVFFDFLTAGLGKWTLSVILGYFTVIVMSKIIFSFFQKVSMLKYVWMSVLGVIVFDFVTGPLIIGLLNGNFFAVLVAQIPFTIMHLASAVFYTVLLVPILDSQIDKRWNIFYWLKSGFSLVKLRDIVSWILVLILLLFAGCSNVDRNSSSYENFTVNVEVTFMNGTVDEKKFELNESVNAFVLMAENFDIEYQMYGNLPFITSIEGSSGNESHYWKLVINGEEAQMGISSYDLDSGTEIDWTLEEIN